MSSSNDDAIANKKIAGYGLFIFVFVAAVQLYAVTANHNALRFITKPLLMPLLAISVYCGTSLARKSYIVLALLFSFLGDTLLLFESVQPLFFIFGLVAFLITHIFYIVYFLKLQSSVASLLTAHPALLLLILAYGVALVWLLYPSLGALRVPVMVYAVTICTMLAASLHVYRFVAVPTGLRFIAGAVLFVVSDSLLAINKFYQPFPLAAFLIMLTYCAAQYCIVKGVLSQRSSAPITTV